MDARSHGLRVRKRVGQRQGSNPRCGIFIASQFQAARYTRKIAMIEHADAMQFSQEDHGQSVRVRFIHARTIPRKV